jgi:hypothetical protein
VCARALLSCNATLIFHCLVLDQAMAASVQKVVPSSAPKSSDAPSLAIALPGATVRRVWEAMFATADFWKSVFDRLGYSNFSSTLWTAPHECKACVQRVIKFVVPLTQAVGPSSTRMTSTQTARLSAAGKRLLIGISTQCHDTPSADAFVVQALIVVDERVGADCVLRVRWSVKFTKSVFLIKGLIESMALRDNHSFYRAMAQSALNALTTSATAGAVSSANGATTAAVPSPLQRLVTMMSRRLPAAMVPNVAVVETTESVVALHATQRPLLARCVCGLGALLLLAVAVCAVVIAHSASNAAADAVRATDVNRDLLLRFDARLEEYGDVLLSALRTPAATETATLITRLETLGAELNDLSWRARAQAPSAAQQRAELAVASALLTARLAIHGTEARPLTTDRGAAVTAECALREAEVLVDTPSSAWSK